MNYFDKLRLEGKKLDEGIYKMTEIWNAPHIHIGRSYTKYTENTEDLQEGAKTNAAAEALSKSVAELKESLILDLEKSEQNLSEMRKFMEESWSIYEDIEQQSSDIEALFTENGYVPECHENEIVNKREEKEDLTTNSTNSDQPEVECTPYLSWKSRMKTFDASTPTVNGFSIKKEIKEEPTVKSIKDLEISMAQKLRMSNNIIQTPRRNSPREPILSRHYYELVKKKECKDEKL